MYDIREFLKNFFGSRLFVFTVVMILVFGMLIGRVFTLQIVNGSDYQKNFNMYAERTLTIEAARGNIYDVNGVLLAGNELAYNVTLEDNGTYSRKEKNKLLNAELAVIVNKLRENGETLVNEFCIDYKKGNYSFNVTGKALERFLADVFGHKTYAELEYNSKFGFDESHATADQVMRYLTEGKDSRYNVDASYDKITTYEIAVVRYALDAYSYARYQSITIAENVSDKTVAFMNEHSDELTGIGIEEKAIRRYYGGESMASIIGYTGRISDEEYVELRAENSSYTSNDTIGKAGLEKYYESRLRGVNGNRQVYVNNVGKISEEISSKDSVAGCDLYLTIDSSLQEGVYYLLEQELAAIVYSKIKADEIEIKDVYFALINNNVIDITHFDDKRAGEFEGQANDIFLSARDRSCSELKEQLKNADAAPLGELSDEMVDYFTYVMDLLKNDSVLLTKEIDTSDSTYRKWTANQISPREYLSYCISKQWIDLGKLTMEEKYSDTSEVYDVLCTYILEHAAQDKEFSKLVYKYLIQNGTITGRQLCLILMEQGVVDYDDEVFQNISNETISPYSFLLGKINKIEITPAQLALDPCTASCVLTDTKTGEVRALVSYPGYDNNKMANGVDAEYFAKLQEDHSKPLYNFATQERTAPGSTYKMISSTAALSEGTVDLDTTILCNGIFEEVSNKPKCWKYPGSHGQINVSQAIRDSCNVFFYTVGYRLSTSGTTYSDSKGIRKLTEYARIYGLDQKTGLEIQENTSRLATEYPVMAAIGQSDNNFTTAALSRYVTAVTTGKLYQYTLMDKIIDAGGEEIETHNREFKDISDTLNGAQWDAIHEGMRMVCEELNCFDNFDIEVAGKTGTAQQNNRPNHALFVGYAPYKKPKVSVAVRIAYGYTSHNAAAVARNILSFYFGKEKLEDILSVSAETIGGLANDTVTD